MSLLAKGANRNKNPRSKLRGIDRVGWAAATLREPDAASSGESKPEEIER